MVRERGIYLQMRDEEKDRSWDIMIHDMMMERWIR